MDKYDQKAEDLCPSDMCRSGGRGCHRGIAEALRESAAEAYEDAAKTLDDLPSNPRFLGVMMREFAASLRPVSQGDK